MAHIPGDIEVKKGSRIMITTWYAESYSETVTGPYHVLDDFYVYKEFERFLDVANIKWLSVVHFKELVAKYRSEFISWLVNQLYLDTEPTDILTLDFRIRLEHREDDSI